MYAYKDVYCSAVFNTTTAFFAFVCSCADQPKLQNCDMKSELHKYVHMYVCRYLFIYYIRIRANCDMLNICLRDRYPKYYYFFNQIF